MMGGLGHQLRDPSGWRGRLTGMAMRLVNSQCNRLSVDALRVRPYDRLLEIGFGPGHGLALMAAQATGGRIFGVDRSDVMIEQAKARNHAAVACGRMTLERADFAELPFADGSMDGVLAVNVAYFWPRSGVVAAEIRRVLRPHGRLVIYVTDRDTMRHWRFAAGDTHRLWDADDLQKMLHAAGFPSAGIEVRRADLRGGVKGLIGIALAG